MEARMRIDICHYYEKELQSVYNAYAKAIAEILGEKCTYHNGFKMSFNLSFAARYNMDSGVCTICLMPCQRGTAVNASYSATQFSEDVYRSCDEELTKNVVSLLGVASIIINANPEHFERYAATQNVTHTTSNIFKNSSAQSQASLALQELKKYKELYDSGILTEEEFVAKKEQLLKYI